MSSAGHGRQVPTKMKLRLFLSFGLVLLPLPVTAEEVDALPAMAQEANATTFLAIYDAARPEDKVHLRDYVGAVQHGVGWANAALRFHKQKPLYCEPEGLALTAEQAIDIIRKEVAARPSSSEFPWPAVMIAALRINFPCRD
jgi:hypothetical protein